jgi:hypothetical protein
VGGYIAVATDQFHQDKVDRSALRRARALDGARVRVERCDDGSAALEPIDAFFLRQQAILESKDPPIGASAPISQSYIHPDPDRRALVDQWLAGRRLEESH